jgi:hypothetical protein
MLTYADAMLTYRALLRHARVRAVGSEDAEPLSPGNGGRERGDERDASVTCVRLLLPYPARMLTYTHVV